MCADARYRGAVYRAQIITSDVRPAFNAVIAAAIRLRNSVVAEIDLVLLVVLAGQFLWRGAVALGSDTWYATASTSARKYTAGHWYAFVTVSGLIAGFIGNRILRGGTILPDYKFDLLGLTVFLLVLVLGLLCVFTPKLHAAKLAGLRTYGRLASDYVVDFAAKWNCRPTPTPEPLLGSAPILRPPLFASSVPECWDVPPGRKIADP
jgi:hypothetical protein